MSYWCILRIGSNKEKQIIEQIDKRLVSAKIDKNSIRMVAPVQKIEIMKNGKKVTKTKSLYPGYMYIEFNKGYSKEIYEIITTSNHVYGFIPGTLTPSEIENILKYTDDYKEKEIVSDEKYLIGEKVNIIDGPFTNYAAKVVDFHEDKKRLKVSVTVFGRDTSVELKTSQVKKFI